MDDWAKVLADCPDDSRRVLVKSYEGELVGIAMFRELSAASMSVDERSAYDLLRRVEEVLAAHFARQLIDELDVDDTGAAAKGRAFAASWSGRSWTDVCAAILPEAKESLVEFRWLRDHVPAELQPIADLLIEHEEALVELFRKNIGRTTTEPQLADAERLLESIGA